ncbi:MAG TPA: methionine--tRNA ligase [Candidatus Baltobacteraceae bacterium]|nr:methionine--tRNA ligase [Candidatus Baltobacteraceae bacterium]
MSRAFYVTTPIYYISGDPHIGHAYTTVVADVLARTARTAGPAFFLTGTDEHGQKVANAAAEHGTTPQAWCDELVPRWQSLFAAYHVEYDDFIRTTQPRHEIKVQRVFERLRASGDVYLGKYEGWYCVNDETFWLESKLVDGRCPTCRREVLWISEDDWFFRLSKYRDRLLAHFKANPEWVRPRSVYNEMVAMLEEGLEDLSISRTNFDWGIPIPDGGPSSGSGQAVIYVWFDALLNYITAIDWSEDERRFHSLWPASVQLVGKEIARFHTIIWPAILWALGEAEPKLVFAHGWITVDGQKMGKSLGNAVDPFLLAERFGADSLRYFLLREAPFGSDFSYSEEKIAQRHNSDLGNDLGNLVKRTISMLQKYRGGAVPARGSSRVFAERFTDLPQRVRGAILNLDFRGALEAAWELVSALNREIDERKPWALAKEGRSDELDALLYDLCEGLRWLAILLHPFMPERTAQMWEQLGLREGIGDDWARALIWGRLEPGTQVVGGEILFPRIELAQSAAPG